MRHPNRRCRRAGTPVLADAEHPTQVQPPGWPHEAGPFDEPPTEPIVLDEEELPWELRDAGLDRGLAPKPVDGRMP